MFAVELDRRLRAANPRVMSVAAHPGIANNDLFRSGDRSALSRAARDLAERLPEALAGLHFVVFFVLKGLVS
ncbi:hypothetical protein [Paraburkholderia youngii]|uniref:hypothetical protein n=1 Tax=Paraburkholderia youngii TaxID=2782701 RepID=UPI003D1953FE